MTQQYENILVAEHFKIRRGVPVAEILGALVAILPFLKKPRYALWHWEGPNPKDWKKYGEFSARQCRKEIAKLVALGCDARHFAYFLPGIMPPPFMGGAA